MSIGKEPENTMQGPVDSDIRFIRNFDFSEGIASESRNSVEQMFIIDLIDGPNNPQYRNVEETSNKLINHEIGFISQLPSKKFQVNKPIPYEIVREQGCYILKQEEFNICEGAEDLEDARFEFMEYIMDDFLNWLDTPVEELSDEGILVLNRYKEYIEYLPNTE